MRIFKIVKIILINYNISQEDNRQLAIRLIDQLQTLGIHWRITKESTTRLQSRSQHVTTSRERIQNRSPNMIIIDRDGD